MIETCVAFNLIILNGRTSGDLSGQYTCFKYNGQSTIDYAIVNEDIFTHVKFFTVSPPRFSSCHSPISFALRLNNMRTHEKVENLHALPVSLKWNSIVRDKFQQVIRSRDFETKLQNLSKPLSQDNINDNNTNENFVSNFTNLFTEAVKTSQPLNFKQKKSSRKKIKPKKWYDKSCWDLKKDVLQCAK